MLSAAIQALSMAFAMGWEILWPLILGFALSAVVQAVVRLASLCRLSGNVPLLRGVLQKRQKIRSLLRVLDARKGHLVAGDEMLRVGDPLVEGLVGPHDAGRFQSRRIAREARQSSGLSVP